jgi:outer membrane protein assembly factor BamC
MLSKNYLIFILLFGLFGCSTTEEFFDDITGPDYVSSSRSKKLEVPPDLTELDENDSYSLPGQAKSYKEYLDREKRNTDYGLDDKPKKIIANPDGMKIIKSGNLRWLVVDKEPTILWPHIKEFWEEIGFRVVIASKKTGIIETEWMDTDDIKLERNKGELSKFDKWLDGISGLTDKRKFRTRVELGENGSTEIYLSQRSLDAVAEQHERIIDSRQSDYSPDKVNRIPEYKGGDNTESIKDGSRDLDDYEIDSELLTRLMIKLGATDFEADKKVNNPIVIVKTEFINNKDDAYIIMDDPFQRAWRRLGLALDIIGFVTEDKNRSEGIYFVRYSEIELPKEKEETSDGILDSLIFWENKKQTKDNKDQSVVNSENETKSLESEVEIAGDIFTGIEPVGIETIGEDIPDEEEVVNKKREEETWVTSLWPSWGDADSENILPENERRYRIRIKPSDNGKSQVYLDYSNGKRNLSKDARNVLSIINEYLK